MADTCRSCGASIRWGTTPAGKKMPLDDKRVMVAELEGEDIVRFVYGYVSHFATCPQATEHRKIPPASEVGS